MEAKGNECFKRAVNCDKCCQEAKHDEDLLFENAQQIERSLVILMRELGRIGGCEAPRNCLKSECIQLTFMRSL